MGFWENVKQFNERWNDLPRRGAIVLMVLLALFVFAGLFSYIAPSVIAMVLAWVIHPVARRLENVFRKIKLPAKLASLIAVIVMYGIVSFILFWIGARVVEELRSLIAAVPGWVSQASDFIQQWTAEGGFETFGVEMFGWQVFDVPPEITDFINAVVNEGLEFVKNFSLSMVGTVSNWTISTVMNLPQIILFIVLTIMGTFYMVADRKRIFAFFERWIPQRATGKLKLLKDTVFRGIAGQIKSALIMMALIAVELSVGFVILRVPYSVLLALLIGIMDALPIIGAGLFLIPMSAFGFITGDIGLGLGVAVLYILTIVTRQIVEPRVVSVQLGLYPLVTMAAMYAGLRVMGFLGMLVGPVLVLILKAALSQPADPSVKEAPRAHRYIRKQKRPPAAGV